MLKSNFFTFFFHKTSQSGYYLDFFIKKISEIIVRQLFIYLGQFFAEKYMIETFTKKIFDKTFNKFNKIFGWSTLLYSTFFLQITSFFFYSGAIFNLLFLI